MLAAEIASVTAKPSMILARNRRVGNLIDDDPATFHYSHLKPPAFVLKTQGPGGRRPPIPA